MLSNKTFFVRTKQIVFFQKVTKSIISGKLRRLKSHEKAYFLMNGKLQTRNEIDLVLIPSTNYARAFCKKVLFCQTVTRKKLPK